MTSSDDQLYQLSQPIPARYIKPPAPGKYGDYVPHYIVTQRLLAVVGPFNWRLIEIIRGDSSGKRTVNGKQVAVEAHDIIVGVVYELTVTVKGLHTVIQEVGSCDNAWKEPDDGARMKKAVSDALKRCAMRLGVALHMWCKTPEEYFLSRVLREGLADEEPGEVVTMGIEAEDAEPDDEPVEKVTEPAPQVQADNVTVTEPPEVVAIHVEPNTDRIDVETELTEQERLIEADADLWSDLYILLSNEFPAAGTKDDITRRVVRLHELCEKLDLWPADSMSALVRAWKEGRDWSDLGKEDMKDYATRAWAKAKARVEELEKSE